ncbi:MAG: hypothetical protein KME26_07055 [Oscillatoria princeps RMCB-10]|nr:hypothetical protein [Oscillatoria princeps RMCB-10]
MTRHHLPNENLQTRAERAASQAAAHPWVERRARFGYAAKGAVCATAGLLAISPAFSPRKFYRHWQKNEQSPTNRPAARTPS